MSRRPRQNKLPHQIRLVRTWFLGRGRLTARHARGRFPNWRILPSRRGRNALALDASDASINPHKTRFAKPLPEADHARAIRFPPARTVWR